MVCLRNSSTGLFGPTSPKYTGFRSAYVHCVHYASLLYLQLRLPGRNLRNRRPERKTDTKPTTVE